MTAYKIVKLREFYPEAPQDLSWQIDDDRVYFPDADGWAGTMSKALTQIMPEMRGSHVIELGSGSLVHGIGLITSEKPPESYVGIDITDSSVFAGCSVARQFRLENRITLLKSDLLENVPRTLLDSANHIFGCLPQMQDHPALIEHFKFNDRNMADIAPRRGLKEDDWGLGLPADALNQIKARAPFATVTLIGAGRPGKERWHNLFNERSYDYTEITSRIVRQDPGTPLDGHVAEEKRSGLNFHYYADPNGSQVINAREAQALIRQKRPAYHDLFVMTATLR